MRASRLIVLTTLLLLALTAGQAGANITVANGDEDAKDAFDGDDYYSFTYRTSDWYGNHVSAVLWRRSVASGSKRKIASFRAAHGTVSQIEASGGRVAVGFQRFDRDKIRSRIVAMNRDGSQSKVLATGTTRNPFVDSPSYDACGKFASIEDVSSDGWVMLSEENQTRRGSKCRYKSSLQSWQYVDFAPDGRRRIIDSGKYTPGLEESTNRWVSLHAEGDFASLLDEKLRVYSKNLVTGAMTGPFNYSAVLHKKATSAVFVALGRNGSLAITSDSGAGRSIKVWTDVFLNPLDPQTAARSTVYNEVRFCGARLLTFDYRENHKSVVLELDPATLKPTGVVANAGRYEWIQSCSSTHVVVARENEFAGSVLHSVTLPSS